MLQALLKSLGVYENSARLRSELQSLVDAQSNGLRRKSSAVAAVVVWGLMTLVLMSATLVVGLVAIYISLREYYGPQLAIWMLLAGLALFALTAFIIARRCFVAIPVLPPINIPELYREPDANAHASGEDKTSDATAQSSSFGTPSFNSTGALDSSLKDWMVKTATQSASSLQADHIPVETLLKSVEPHVSAVAHSAIDEVTVQLEKGSKSKIALILGSAVLVGVLLSRTSK